MSFIDWLKSLVVDLSGRIKDMRAYSAFVDEVICDKERFYIWKKREKDRTRIEGNTTIIELAPLVPELVKPTQIRLIYQGDLHRWYEDKTIMDVYLGAICREVLSYEITIFAETLTRNVQVFNLDSKIFTMELLRNPISHIGSQGCFADTLLVHPIQSPILRQDTDFLPYWNLPQSFIEKKGRGFIGLMGQLSLYETLAVSESAGILYEKRQVKIRKTPLDIGFDDNSRPKTLSVHEDMFAWSVEDDAIIKVDLKT